MGKIRTLPGGVTILDVPRPIIMDINRIGDYFNILRVVTDEIGEYCADKGLHTAAGENLRISAASRVSTENSLSPYLDTIIMGISWDLQYRKNSLKPESSWISVWCSPKSQRGSCDKREGVLSLSTFLHSSNVCPFLLTLSNISRKASLRERQLDRTALHTYIPEYCTTGKDIQITLSPLFLPITEKICHVCRSLESKDSHSRQMDGSELTIVRVIRGDSTVPVRTEGSRGMIRMELVRFMECTVNTYQSVKTTNFLSS